MSKMKIKWKDLETTITMPWQGKVGITFMLTLIAMICDASGFAELVCKANGITNFIDIFSINNITTTVPIILGLAIAFDVSPVFIGYALCLIKHGLASTSYDKEKDGKYTCFKEHKPALIWFVLIFDSIAFATGFVINCIMRYSQIGSTDYAGGYERFPCFMMFLPLITSLVTLSAGCLSCDPYIFDLHNVSKRLAMLQTQKANLKAIIKGYEDENEQLYNGANVNNDNDIDLINKWKEMICEQIDAYVDDCVLKIQNEMI